MLKAIHAWGLAIGVLCSVSVPAMAETPPTAAETAPVGENPDEWADVSFVIVTSTPKYEDALEAARKVAKGMGVKLDLRGLSPSAVTGLTSTPKVCEQNEWSYPCYVARGRYDEGTYVSIEHSSAYVGFAKDLYVVIVASGLDGETSKQALQSAQRVFPDTYEKTAKVFLGCIH